MTSLTDLSPIPEEVDINGTKHLVRGLALTDILRLIGRFPGLRVFFEGGEPDWSVMWETIADASAPIIAASVRKLGDEDVERWASELELEPAFAIMEQVKARTMPSGVGPFVVRVRALLQRNAGDNSAPGKDSKSTSSQSSPRQ
jgi:hypothetical protein